MNLALLAVIASFSFAMLIGILIISVMVYGKLTSIDNRVNKLDIDSERIKHSSQRVQSQLEVVLNEMNAVNSGMDMDMGIDSGMANGQRRIFKSLDGKHEAESFEKLIEKMRQDPDYQNMQQMLDDDEEDEDKPWENKDK